MASQNTLNRKKTTTKKKTTSKKPALKKPDKASAAPKKYKKAYTPALYGKGQTGSRRWQIDMDYVNKLSEEERIWLDQFVHEYHLASFKEGKKHLHKKKQRKEIYGKNNASNRCITSLQGSKTQKLAKGAAQIIDSIHDTRDYYTMKDQLEDAVVSLIDLAGKELPDTDDGTD